MRGLFILLMVESLHGATLPFHHIIRAEHLGISKRFVQTVKFPCDSLGSVIYGNSRYGYFETSRIKKMGKSILIELVPPGYRTATDFYLKTAYGEKFLGSREFVSPVPHLFKNLEATVKGKFSSPYFMIGNGALLPPESGQPEVPGVLQVFVILNRVGEITWLHVPSPGDSMTRQELIGKVASPGRFAILVSHDHFEVVDFKGEVSHNIRFASGETRLGPHHDFLVLDPDHFLAIGSEFRYIRLPHPIFPPVAPVGKQPYRRTPLVSHPRQFRIDTLLTLDLLTGIISPPLWNSLSVISPHRVHKVLEVRGGTIEFTHLNSLSQTPSGYLISMSQQNRLALVGKDFRTHWTLGSSPSDTYRWVPPQLPFRVQHHASWMPNGHILLMDNRGAIVDESTPAHGSSRILEIALTNPISIERIWTPSPPLFAPTRGSTHLLDNGNVLAFFPSPFNPQNPEFTQPDTLIEFNRQGGQAARMQIQNPFPFSNPDGYRADPLDSIAGEKPLNFAPKRGPFMLGSGPTWDCVDPEFFS